ncbi:MAG: type transport system permease protein [Gaiellaceae bacterium]|nr:type transport system permease protein [Gaiellaceae bacterium]
MSAQGAAVARRNPARSDGIAERIGTIAVAYYWELRKLAAQRRSWLGFVAAGVVSLVFLISILLSKVTPNDGPYADPMGQGLRHSGFALAPVVLTEIGYFGPAIIAALVAGDIVAVEDMGGTLKTILVRSVRRGELLAAKTLALFTYIVMALIVYGVIAIAAGAAAWGVHPLANISGQRISGLHALASTFAALAVYSIPTMAIAAFGLFLSVVTRQSVAGVVGTIFYVLGLQGLAALPAIASARPYILVTQLHAWHGPFTTPTDWGLIGHAMWVSALYALPPLVAAWWIFQHRDVAT